MPWIVDGDNLLGKERGDVARRDLVRRCRELAVRERKRIVLVFDGEPVSGLPGRDVLFSGAGRTADDLIEDRLKGERDRSGWILVTDDRRLKDRCRHWHGVRNERRGAFLERLEELVTPDRAGTGPLPDVSDIEKKWLEEEGEG